MFLYIYIIAKPEIALLILFINQIVACLATAQVVRTSTDDKT
ncbi:hypothetical protein ACF3DV_04710 [Chlorogloeopsis fritschii PCC 9212]